MCVCLSYIYIYTHHTHKSMHARTLTYIPTYVHTSTRACTDAPTYV